MLAIQLYLTQTYKYPNTTIYKVVYLQGFHFDGFVFVWWTETTVSGAEDSMETNEAAAALLNMESPNNILDEKRMSKLFCMFCSVKNGDKHFSFDLTLFLSMRCILYSLFMVCMCFSISFYV